MFFKDIPLEQYDDLPCHIISSGTRMLGANYLVSKGFLYLQVQVKFAFSSPWLLAAWRMRLLLLVV